MNYHGRRKHFCSREAIGGIKTIMHVQVLGGSGGMPPEKFSGF